MPIKGWLKERWMSPYNKIDREAFTTGLIETSFFFVLKYKLQYATLCQ